LELSFPLEWERVHFEIVGAVTEIELIASGRGVRRLKFLRKPTGDEAGAR
jgi:hypothetical protein